ncbi:Cofilin [Dactylellina cionopaga]|nr:Cofilin [Dactylellina cionopaga]
MSAGTTAHDECSIAYHEFSVKKQHTYIFFKLSDNFKHVVLDKVSANSVYDDFIADLPDDDCRYVLYNFPFQGEDGEDMNKILFILWCPDSVELKSRMIYTSDTNNLRKSIQGIGAYIEATDKTEISHETVLEKFLRK